MSNIQPAVDEKERRINSESIFNFKNLPKRENWDPEKYMREHLYMSYSEPRLIKIKLPSDKFTVLHDWFGSHYSKCKERCEDGYEIVEVVSSPDMIVHWALQYAGTVEILDEEIRKRYGKKKKLCEKYEK